MGIKIETDIKASSKNYTKMSHRDIKYIIIHGTSCVAPLDNFALNLKNNSCGGSAHYFVKDGRIRKVMNDMDIAWAVGNSHGWYTIKNASCHNSNSISIEMCDANTSGKMSESTISATSVLVKQKMKQYDIPESHVIRHYDVLNKKCPQYYISTSRWNKLKKTLLDNTVKKPIFIGFLKKDTYARESSSLKSKHVKELHAGALVKIFKEVDDTYLTNYGYVLKKRLFSATTDCMLNKKTYGRTSTSLTSSKVAKLVVGDVAKVYGFTPDGKYARTTRGYVLRKRLKND